MSADKVINFFNPFNPNLNTFTGVAKSYIDRNRRIEYHLGLSGKWDGYYATVVGFDSVAPGGNFKDISVTQPRIGILLCLSMAPAQRTERRGWFITPNRVRTLADFYFRTSAIVPQQLYRDFHTEL